MSRNFLLLALMLVCCLGVLVIIWHRSPQWLRDNTPHQTYTLNSERESVVVTGSVVASEESVLSFLRYDNATLTDSVSLPIFAGVNVEDQVVAERINDVLQKNLLYDQVVSEWRASKLRHESGEQADYVNPSFLEYEVTYPVPGLVAVTARSEYCAAYCTNNTITLLFERASGNLLTPKDIFTDVGWRVLGEEKTAEKRETIERFVAQAEEKLLQAVDPDERERLEGQIQHYPTCVSYYYDGYHPLNYSEWQLNATTTTFIDGPCFPHALRAWDDMELFRFEKNFTDIREYLTPLGKNLFLSENLPI